jgi:hypothetical protein
VDADGPGRKQIRKPLGPLDDGDAVGPECLFEPEVGALGGIVHPIEVEVLDGRRPIVPLAKDESWARDGYIAAMELRDECSDESRFTGAEVAGQRQRIARTKRLREPGGDRAKRIKIEKIEEFRGHALPFDERIEVLVRASDVVVGIIAGAVCAVLSAAFEGGILALRFFSIEHLGGHFGNEFAVFALAGGAIGGLVAFGAGTLFRREPATR